MHLEKVTTHNHFHFNFVPYAIVQTPLLCVFSVTTEGGSHCLFLQMISNFYQQKLYFLPRGEIHSSDTPEGKWARQNWSE